MECVARKGAIWKPSSSGTIEESGNACGDEIMNSDKHRKIESQSALGLTLPDEVAPRRSYYMDTPPHTHTLQGAEGILSERCETGDLNGNFVFSFQIPVLVVSFPCLTVWDL